MSLEKASEKASLKKELISSVLIRVSKGKPYAEVLGKLCKKVNPDAIGSMVVSARATQKGDFLILLDRGSHKEGFTEEVERVAQGLGEGRADSKKFTL